MDFNIESEFYLAHGSHFLSTRISRLSRILSLRLVVNDSSLWLLARCEWQLVVVIGLLWLLTHCGYWLVVVIDLLCFKWQIKKDIREPCEALADPWVRSVCEINIFVRFVPHVSAPLRTKICEIRVLKNIRVIRVITSLRSVGLRRISCSKWWVVQDDKWFICGKWIHVIGVTHDRCDTWFW